MRYFIAFLALWPQTTHHVLGKYIHKLYQLNIFLLFPNGYLYQDLEIVYLEGPDANLEDSKQPKQSTKFSEKLLKNLKKIILFSTALLSVWAQIPMVRTIKKITVLMVFSTFKINSKVQQKTFNYSGQIKKKT